MWRAALLVVLAAAGCGRLGFDEQVASPYAFVDETQASFDLGTYDTGTVPVAFVDGRLRLAGDGPYARTDVGIYLSRVLDTGDPDARWETLRWLGPSPQGRALPDNEAIDEGYAEGALRMADNILLLHFDGGETANAARVSDASGRQHHGELVLAGQGAQYVPGAFGQALDLDRDAWVRLDGGYFDYGTGDFTYAVWTRMFDCAQSNDNRIALGGAGAGDTPHMWIGVLCPDSCPGRDGAFMNWRDNTRAGGAVTACSGVVLDDGNWHLLAGVKRGHTPATLALYVDGREVGTDTFDYGGGTFTYDAGEIRLGSFNLNDPQYHTRIVVDEAAIWKRALTAAEIEDIYRRGALRVELQFRVCADGGCDSEPFIGPDGTTASYFTEADLVGPAGGQRGNLSALGLVGRAAQYRVRMSTAPAAVSPSLLRVAVDAAPP